MKNGFSIYVITVLLFLSPLIVQADNFDRVNIFVSDNSQSRLIEKKLVDSLGNRQILFSSHTIRDPDATGPAPDFRNSLNVAVGTDAARYLLGQSIDAPVYSVLVPEVTFHNLVIESGYNVNRLTRGDIGAFFIDQPLRRYLSLARMMGKGIMDIALFQDEEQYEIDRKKPVMESPEFNLHTHVLSGKNSSISEIEDILSMCDLAIIRPGKYLNPFVSKWILYAAYREKVPVISFSESFLDAGSVASLSSDVDRMVKEISDHVIGILDKGKIDGGERYSDFYKLRINRSAARFLNIRLPDSPELD